MSEAILSEELHRFLKSDPRVGSFVNSRIWEPGNARHGAKLPYIIIRRQSASSIHYLGGASGIAEDVHEIMCFANSVRQSRDLADAVRGALDGYSGSVGAIKIQRSHLVGESDTVHEPEDASEGYIFETALDFDFHYERQQPIFR